MRETGFNSVRVLEAAAFCCCAAVAASNAALVASVGVMLGAGDTAVALVSVATVALMEAVFGSLLFSVVCDEKSTKKSNDAVHAFKQLFVKLKTF